MKFIDNLSKSHKPIVKTLLEACKNSTLSTTGRNLRSIKLLTGSMENITIDSAFLIEYHQVTEDNSWRVEWIDGLLDEAELRNLDDEELELLDYACSS